jgi:hypothetical protein
MLRSEIVKQALQQGFASHSRWLLQYLGLNRDTDPAKICFFLGAALFFIDRYSPNWLAS